MEEPTELIGLIGIITLEWSAIEGIWHSIFLMLYAQQTARGEVHLPALNALYNSHRSSAGQRQMVLDYAKAILNEKQPKLIEELGKLYQATGRLSGVRNAIQHAQFAPVGSDREALKLSISPLNPSAKLTDTNLIDELAAFIPKAQRLRMELNFWMLRLMGHKDKYPPAETSPPSPPET